ncbi:hypothetical protein [Tellurirhabdus bombi]|uniref:hypothetical protein n=1 Tax=Tellurirhabdus bombi TaxID=2907205 RepID=UPI001F269DDE|nr:hypothetical protein [Tellurirhabdus bombi]
MKPYLVSLRIVFLASIFLFQSCSKDEETQPAASGISINNTSLGNVLTDETGRTLYFFANDVDGASTCKGNCLTNWPVFYRENPSLGTGLNASDFGTITNADGSKQTTYKTWPLYYYAKDAKAGDVSGENVGNIWFVAKPDYSIMLSNAQLKGHDGKSYTSKYVEGTESTIFFVDAQGRTLYGFRNDKNKKNNFTKADFSNNSVWPIFETTLGSVPSVLDKTLFSTISVAGRNQLTYNGWPLYYFGQDNNQRGVTKGVSFPSPGVWPIIQKETPVAPQ